MFYINGKKAKGRLEHTVRRNLINANVTVLSNIGLFCSNLKMKQTNLFDSKSISQDQTTWINRYTEEQNLDNVTYQIINFKEKYLLKVHH